MLYIVIWFWSNFFIVLSRFFGVTKTIWFIKQLVRILPLQNQSLDDISEKAGFLHQRIPFLFIARKQKCLIRGFLLFFFGKRMKLDICLRFGCELEDNTLKTHCWILENNAVRFEANEIINKYGTLVDYT